MDKLPKNQKFFDISDYSRYFSRLLVNSIKNTDGSPLFFTTLSLISGIIAAVLIYFNQIPVVSAFLILLKSFFDAVDGELARARNRPSLVGRFYDSVVDFFVNVFLLLSLTLRFDISLVKFLAVVITFHIQGSVYNYYYVLKRHKVGGDKTSKINETKIENVYPWDNPFWLKIFHSLYVMIYSWQDFLIRSLDKEALKLPDISNKFMTIVSLLGLGTQLLIISILILMNLENLIVDFFLYYYSILALLIIVSRKIFWVNG